MTQPNPSVFPPGRYGRRREPKRAPRWTPVTLLAVGLVALFWLTLRLYTQYGANRYDPGPVRYGPVSDSQVTVTFDLRKPPSRTVTCRLRALDRTGAETGYAEVHVGTGDPVTTTYTIHTKARAVLVDILGCAAAPR